MEIQAKRVFHVGMASRLSARLAVRESRTRGSAASTEPRRRRQLGRVCAVVLEELGDAVADAGCLHVERRRNLRSSK
jgi:hypothetical protein